MPPRAKTQKGSARLVRTPEGFKPGDHVCCIYSNHAELAETVADFLAAGLRRNERCWYVASHREDRDVRAALRVRQIDVRNEIERGALRVIKATDAYLIDGKFNPEETVRVFNNAIEEALADGFSGFRAAAEMSWALDGGLDRVIVYEALLRTTFAACRVIGLCLYHRKRMPVAIINGALATHPIAGENGRFALNPLYDRQ